MPHMSVEICSWKKDLLPQGTKSYMLREKSLLMVYRKAKHSHNSCLPCKNCSQYFCVYQLPWSAYYYYLPYLRLLPLIFWWYSLVLTEKQKTSVTCFEWRTSSSLYLMFLLSVQKVNTVGKLLQRSLIAEVDKWKLVWRQVS